MLTNQSAAPTKSIGAWGEARSGDLMMHYSERYLATPSFSHTKSFPVFKVDYANQVPCVLVCPVKAQLTSLAMETGHRISIMIILLSSTQGIRMF